jgi:predicted nuclease of predicted toxin-antitoxin system
MPVLLYMDVHVPQAITDQLRRRGVDVVTSAEDGTDELDDDVLLEHVRSVGRVIFTQDIRFRALAEDWIRQGRPFAGLVFGHQMGRIDRTVRARS